MGTKNRHEIRKTWEGHLEPLFSRHLASEISTNDLREWIDELTIQYAPNSVAFVYGKFRTFPRWCVTKKIIAYSPLTG